MFSVKNTVIYTFFGIQSVQNTVFCSVFNALASKNPSIPLSPQTLENIAIYTVFFNFSMFQCRWPTQTYIQKAFKNIVFFTVLLHSFYNVFRQKHRNLHIFSAYSRSKTLFFAVFSMLWHPNTLQNIAIYNVFFIFVRFSIHFNTLFSSDTKKSQQKISQTPPDSGLGAKPFLPPHQLKLI